MALGLVMGRSVLAENGSVAAVTVRSAGAQEYIKVVGSTDTWSAGATSGWWPVTSAAISVPAGHSDLVTVDFFAESYCGNENGLDFCLMRVRVGAVEFAPADSDFRFDATQEINDSAYGRESQAMSRFLCLNGGANGATYRIYLDGSREFTNTTFQLDDWTLRLTRSHGCNNS
jgi:hypothetical protein